MGKGNKKQIRILHVVGGMNRGGVETWLMHVLRNIDRDRFHMDFLVHTTEPCAYDDEIRELGSRVISCMHPSNPLTYTRNFKRILGEFGPYDIIHSHVHYFSGYTLRLACQVGVPVRIAHSHNDTSLLQEEAEFLRRSYIDLAKRWISRYATCGLAASNKAASDLFGEGWVADKRWQVLYCAIDLSSFSVDIDSTAIRRELGIPKDALVVGHVGRFAEQKNHNFLIDIVTEIAEREPRIHLLLIGDGPLRPVIEQKVAKMGLADRVLFAGSRHDVPKLMLGAIDIFVMPSLYEGLGLVLVEAQAAGIPCIFSDCVPGEADIINPLIRRLSLSQPASVWADVILDMLRDMGSVRDASYRHDCFTAIEASPFNIQTGIKLLEAFYEGGFENA
ncbi:MAG: glycosyltransferase family 1 protein [Candidatus Aquicultor sp.]